MAAGEDCVGCAGSTAESLMMYGGIDKRVLELGPEAIDAEVLSKVPWLMLQGGFTPWVDHLVPARRAVPGFGHYQRLINRVAEDPERRLHEARARGFWKTEQTRRPQGAREMNSRERFLAAMKLNAPDGVPLPCLFQRFEAETIRRWQREGLPRDVHLVEHFGFERCELAPVNLGPIPAGDLADAEDALGVADRHRPRAHRRGRRTEATRVKETYPLARPGWLAGDAAPAQPGFAGALPAVLGRLRRARSASATTRSASR